MHLYATHLSKTIQRRHIVKDISLEVHPREIVGLLGPNGAGKTTTFNMLTGILSVTSGNIRLGDKPLNRAPLEQRVRMGLSYLPQQSTVFLGLTVIDNLRVACEHTNLSRTEATQKIEAMLDRFQLQRIRHTRGHSLSGGEKRRLELARALLTRPKLILLDEPFAGVDPIAIDQIRNDVVDMKARGLGVLITDHNVRETLRICDRAYILFEGTILVSGTTDQIVNHPDAKLSYLGEKFTL